MGKNSGVQTRTIYDSALRHGCEDKAYSAADECSAIPSGTVHESQEVSEGASQERKDECAILGQASRVVRQDEANRNVPRENGGKTMRSRWRNDGWRIPDNNVR
jgi:hypothetical protein